jgi:polyferredoxin
MIFSPLDALLFRKRLPAAQRRVEIFVGAAIVLVGTPCGFFGATSLLGRIFWPAITLIGGISMIVTARRDAKKELAAAAANAETGGKSQDES